MTSTATNSLRFSNALLVVLSTITTLVVAPPVLLGAEADRMSGPSTFAAAIVVAYTDYAKAAGSETTPFTATELSRKFRTIEVRQVGDNILVEFRPVFREDATGGSVVYIIAGKSFTIVERIFGR